MHRHAVLACWIVVATCAWTRPSAAQDSSTYYTVMHPAEFKINWKAFYDKAEAATADTRKALPHHLNLAYGTDAKQKLDVYLPTVTPTAAPVFIYLHGGGFREGDRAQYGYVARPFAAHGVITVVASYRLTPSFHFPDQPNDVKQVLAWVARHIKTYGGDAQRMYLSGHSAGAILTATVCVNTDWATSASFSKESLKGCVPISGSYDVRTERGVPGYVNDPTLAAQASPVMNVGKNPPPFLLVAGSVEEPYIVSSHRLADTLKANGGAVSVLVLKGQAHDDTAWSLHDERSELVQAILKMIKPERRASAF
jgi:acetyl esterase/lipase